MKKIDKLILTSFAGPFIMTFLVVVFILLTQHMLKYFDDIIGKDLGWEVLSQLLFYFAIFMTPVAMPLAVLLSSLITFGNLGEHFELTAIKGAGISLLRTIRPIFFFVVFLTGIAFYINNNLVPRAALEAYSLLYDIKQKKPALDLREGAFYNGLPDISIKVNKKFPDGITLKDIIVYDHRNNDGNKQVTIADSGKMSTILNERYLKFELYNGYFYSEGASGEREITGQKNTKGETLSRTKFYKEEVVFDLSSFQLERTDKKWFETNRIMRNLSELDADIDSINNEMLQQELNHFLYKPTYFSYFNKDSVTMPEYLQEFKVRRDSINRFKYMPKEAQQQQLQAAESDTTPGPAAVNPTVQTQRSASGLKKRVFNESPTTAIDVPSATAPRQSRDSLQAKASSDSVFQARIDSVFDLSPSRDIVQAATNMARQVKSQVLNSNAAIQNYQQEKIVFEIQWHKIIANSVMCIAMFLIGAPLGAIIKRGGLGVPFLISILFFIIYYLLNMQGEKLAKQGLITPMAGIWAADVILLVIGFVFLRQARADARLFDADAYLVFFDRARQWFAARKLQSKAAA
ncbi:MAG TPA: LptF/LptG family permease [Chryseosolibacter sp.]|nr:LptF/LptG family permease [Chryseosolibacter sp.]